MGKRSWADEEFIQARETSQSIAEMLRKLGLVPAGGNYEYFYQHLDRLGLSRPPGQRWSAGKNLGPRRPIESFLVNGVPTSTNQLRKRLLASGLKQHKCEKCGLAEWLGQPIPLELDHIDGDRANNSFENLRILCPNCHAQTDTYRGRNQRAALNAGQRAFESRREDQVTHG
jgi:hypothetical protein